MCFILVMPLVGRVDVGPLATIVDGKDDDEDEEDDEDDDEDEEDDEDEDDVCKQGMINP